MDANPRTPAEIEDAIATHIGDQLAEEARAYAALCESTQAAIDRLTEAYDANQDDDHA